LVEDDVVGKILILTQADIGLNLTATRTRKLEFLDEMERVVPWGALFGA
jgi:IS5 family transposase